MPKDLVAWAFGLGLERIAMVLFGIPDIRLFWSEDPRFLQQFQAGKINRFKPFSKFPSCWKDVSFWVGDRPFHGNDMADLVRDVAGSLVEEINEVRYLHSFWTLSSLRHKVDKFVHPKTGRQSLTFRINYRSMER